MSSKLLASAVLVLGLSSCASFASREPDAGVAVRFGQAQFTDEDSWNEAENQTGGGVSLFWPIARGPWNYEVGVSRFDEKSTTTGNAKFETSTTEFSLGLRRSFPPLWSTIHPYLGGGGSAYYTEQELSPLLAPRTETEDWNGGVYLSAGFWGLLGEHARVGAELRLIGEEFIDSGGLHMDHSQLAVTLGYGF